MLNILETMVTLPVCFNFNLFDKHMQLGIMSTFKENWIHKNLDWKKYEQKADVKADKDQKQQTKHHVTESMKYVTYLIAVSCFFLSSYLHIPHPQNLLQLMISHILQSPQEIYRN